LEVLTDADEWLLVSNPHTKSPQVQVKCAVAFFLSYNNNVTTLPSLSYLPRLDAPQCLYFLPRPDRDKNKHKSTPAASSSGPSRPPTSPPSSTSTAVKKPCAGPTNPPPPSLRPTNGCKAVSQTNPSSTAWCCHAHHLQQTLNQPPRTHSLA